MKASAGGSEWNPAGRMPTTVYGSPPSRIGLPTKNGSAPRWVRQTSSVKTTARGPLGESSCGRNERPVVGETPKTWKYSADTWMPLICCGRSPEPRLKPGPEKSYRAIASRVWLAFFHAMNLGIETEPPPLFCPLKLRCTRMIRSEWGYGRGASKTAVTTEKIAVLAPMPRARAATATVVKPGLAIKTRKEWRRSERRLLIPLWYEQPF